MIKSISRLVRIPNLAMVFLSMYLMRWSIVLPILDLMGFEMQMPEFTFFLLVLSTVCITAAGNVINDYHDVSVDRFNQPDRVVIDKFIGRRSAIILHFALNSVGIILGVYVSFYHHLFWLSPIFIIVPVGLWLYSTIYKHRVFVGNFLISVVTAMVPLLVVLFEYPLICRVNQDVLIEFPDMFHPILYWVGLFAAFAFVTNLIREIIKDAEDIEGDKEVGSKTIAVVYGLKVSNILALILVLVSLIGLALIFILFLRDWLSLTYFVVFLALPLIILFVQLLRVKDSKGYRRLNHLTQIIMLAGLVYAPIAYFIMNIVLI